MPNPLVRQISFNHHQDCFALATDEGVRIFNSDPLIELINLKSQDVGSIRLVALLNRTNLVAMVSGNPRPKFANNAVMIYDTKLKKFVVEVAVGGPILNIAFTTNRLIVVLHCYIYIFNTSNFELVRTEETIKNPQGLISLSPDNKLEILAYPGTKVGSVQLVNLQNASQSRSLAPSVIFAHKSPLSRIVLNNQATRIATGSLKGTVIKLFNTRTRELLFELRRGVDTAALHCLRFSYDSAYLAVSSDKGTIHVFSLSESDADKQSIQKIFDSMRFAKDERRSAVQFSLPNSEQMVECAFITSSMTSGLSDQPVLDKDLIAIGYDGTYYRFSECSSKPQGHELLFDLAADQEFWNDQMSGFPWPEFNTVEPNLINKPVGKVINFDKKIHSWNDGKDDDRKIHSIIYNHEEKKLKVLDQLKLPDETVFVDILSTEDAFNVIKKMQVRGAPLIATVGTLALGIELEKNLTMNYNDLLNFIAKQAAFLTSSRPTAVNLRNALLRVDEIVRIHEKEKEPSTQSLIQKIQDAAFKWFLDERAENDLLLRNAVICLEANVLSNEKLTVMTICNTGSLATSSHGTALGVIRKLYLRNRLQLAFILETRPYNQGSRLTAYECVKEGIPFKLITDSMAAAAMKTYKIDAVLVGADQVAQNGDTANKIGTYMLAVLANFHRIPFYVVTPSESINPRIKSGTSIKIEERPANELIMFNGKSTAPEGTQVWNPAFDVTPGCLITGILTENGNIVPGQHSAGVLSLQSKIEG